VGNRSRARSSSRWCREELLQGRYTSDRSDSRNRGRARPSRHGDSLGGRGLLELLSELLNLFWSSRCRRSVEQEGLADLLQGSHLRALDEP